MWLEMSREPTHGGVGWEFGTCVWSPSRKQQGGRWPFWELLLKVRQGDTIFHLRGINEHAAFVGYSVADTDGYSTTRRPPEPGDWAYAREFHRVPLRNFTAFSQPVSLSRFWKENDSSLRDYYAMNRSRHRDQRRHIFFVVQGGRLQCLNGAYFSEVDAEFAEIMLPRTVEAAAAVTAPRDQVAVGEEIRSVRMRIGQERFSAEVRENYGWRCCFPDCEVIDPVLLVGSHIGRWSDALDLRGDVANGLCLCLMHDRAFENGLYTLDRSMNVRVNPIRVSSVRWADKNLHPFDGRAIRNGPIVPDARALLMHWERIGFAPES